MFELHLTLAYVVAHFSDIAERFGVNHKQEDSCRYADAVGFTLKPVCIVGQFFADLGLLALVAKPELFSTEIGLENLGTCGLDQDGAHLWNALAAAGITWDDDAQKFMAYVQTYQDGRFNDVATTGLSGQAARATWAEAVTKSLAKMQEDYVQASPYLSLAETTRARFEVQGITESLNTSPWVTEHDPDEPPF